MLIVRNPSAIQAPFARYSHGIEAPAGARFVFCSGQLGIAPDGAVPESAEDQAELCFANIRAILVEAGMDFPDLVRINGYVTDRLYMPAYMNARDRIVASPPPASTLVIVGGFTRPEFKIEIEAVAAKADR